MRMEPRISIRRRQRSARLPSGQAGLARMFDQHVVTDHGELSAAQTPIVRKSADALTGAEQRAFKNAITRAIEDGTYSTLVRIHAVMSHDMHTMTGMPAGSRRFL